MVNTDRPRIHLPAIILRMSTWSVGRFEVRRRDLLRTVLASATLVPASAVMRSQRSARLWARAARKALGLAEDIQGLDRVSTEGPYLVTPLHEGFADVLLLGHLPLDLRFVVRDELFEWPWLGRGLRSTSQIRLSPEDGVGAMRRLLRQASESFDRGESLVVFPQGTILGVETAFRPAAFRLADMLGVPVLPVVITGTHTVWEHPFSDRFRFGQRVSMHVLEPLPVGEARRRMTALQTQMKELALAPGTAPARRFDPDRDGFWDDYSYEIDAAFPEVARQVAEHRAAVGSAVGREPEIDPTV